MKVKKLLGLAVAWWFMTVSVDASQPACSTARSVLQAYDSAIQMYAVDHGLPNDGSWYENLISAGYISRSHPRNDPWGHPYYYRVVENSYDLRTLGPDGRLGTDDDQSKRDGWQWHQCSPPILGWLRCN